MKEVNSPSKTAIQYGVIFGVIMIIELVVSFSFNIQPSNQAYGITINVLNYFILPITLITMGCNNYKNNFNSGFISLGESLKVGVTICIIAALIYTVFYIVFNMIFPEFSEEILNKVKEEIIKQSEGQPKEQTEMALSMTETMMKPYIVLPFTIVMYAFIGLIYSLIIGAIVKKDRHNSY
nr:DUF4199 domain-containing protein [uncultured Flavobacterium sp.]